VPLGLAGLLLASAKVLPESMSRKVAGLWRHGNTLLYEVVRFFLKFILAK